jgi:hypothetical protein
MTRAMASAAALTVVLLGFSADARPLTAPQEAKIKPVGAPIHCIHIHSINDMRIRDDQTIDFYLAGRKVYRNHLPLTCTGLAQEERFTFSRTLPELCNSDAIRVVRGFTAVTPGASCSLGDFQEISGAPRPVVPSPEDDFTPRSSPFGHRF